MKGICVNWDFFENYWIVEDFNSINQANRDSDNYDIVKAQGGEIKVEIKQDREWSLLFNYL